MHYQILIFELIHFLDDHARSKLMIWLVRFAAFSSFADFRFIYLLRPRTEVQKDIVRVSTPSFQKEHERKIKCHCSQSNSQILTDGRHIKEILHLLLIHLF